MSCHTFQIYFFILLLPSFCCKEKISGENEPISATDPPVEVQIPKYIWPLREALDKSIIINYFDTNSGTGFRDYQCGNNHGYDGHLGLDIAIYNFRLMDEGVPVVASAPGTVINLENSKFDRVYWTPYIDSGNFVSIGYPDGSYTVYYHLRKNSVPLKINETVEQGQFLGYVGSSGATPFPHLHLETKINGTISTDPFSGGCGNPNSLWLNQPSYVGNSSLQILDADIFNEVSIEGEFQYGEIKTLKDRPFSPSVYGINEEKLGLWVQVQGQAGQQFEVQILKPNGETFIEETKSLQSKRRYGWIAMNWDFSDETSQNYGIWTANILVNNKIQKEIYFEVNEKTEFGPRFYPLAGISVHINGINQRVELHISGDDSNPEFTIEGDSYGATIGNGALIIPGISSQPDRTHHFKVIATDNKGRTDTYNVQMIDFEKPVNQ